MNCCVPGCKGQSSPRHRFPNPSRDKEQFDRWLEMVGNVSLVGMDPMLIYKNRRVCDIHFDKSDIFGSRSSLPTLNLSTPPSTADDDSVSMAGSSQSDVSDVNIVDKPTEEPPDREVTAHGVAIKTEPLESDFQQQLFVKIEPMHCDNSEDGTPIRVKSEGGTDVEQLKQEELIIEHKTEVDSEGDIANGTPGKSNRNLGEGRHEAKKFSCDLCISQFIYKGNLKEHILSKHNNPLPAKSNSKTRTFTCDQCGQQYKQARNLRRHLLQHEDPSTVEMYRCSQCDYQSMYKDYVQAHMVVHKEVKILKGNLRRHTMFMHEDASQWKMYKCDQCD